MKILYISDLDGTLLNSNAKLSKNTIKIINDLVNKGMYFSYATARSLSSASIVTNGLILDLPVIIYNGTFIINTETEEKLFSLYFNEYEKKIVMDILDKCSLYPLVYGYVNGKERVSWLTAKENDGIKRYLDLRKGDNRLRPIGNKSELYSGELFYFTCIGEKYEFLKIYEYFKDSNEFTCTLQKELYCDSYWCEIMLKNATKGNAIINLKEKLGFDKIISFGDAINDISMFNVSDESYAVENAVDELKNISTGIIKSNNEDGVANWLYNNYNNKA
jgi:Cof subfamily protein (haloacid dehalogenase superfamily)